MKDELSKEFGPSSWAIDNKTSIYILTIIITLAGVLSYLNLPKEQFPQVVFPQIVVLTADPGTSPKDMENLVTKQIEKQVKSIGGIKKVTSHSVQDFSDIIVEFNTDVKVDYAKTQVKDAVDRAKPDLPNNLPAPPNVIDIDVSEIPIMNVNISGDYSLDKLKKFADQVKDQIEGVREIRRVDLIGALEREIQINLDKNKMEAAGITFDDIYNGVHYENINVPGGEISMDGMKRSIQVNGEYPNPEDIRNIVITSATGARAYIKDIATVVDGYHEKESYARLNRKNVITLNVIKRSGENLIKASDSINSIIERMKKTSLPKDLVVTVTGDQSESTRSTLNDLINTIIIGFILVTLILMFFMGATNAIFVAMSVPLSCFVAFLIMPSIGFTLNFIVLFSFLLALGIVVDDAIVVIENTHRIFNNGKVPIKKAAKAAAGEIFLPVLSGTLTTLAPFIPLAFWNGVIGKFMFFLPITLIITLIASLFVAYIINPVFAVDFMKPHTKESEEKESKINRGYLIVLVAFSVIALLSYISHNLGLGNFMVFAFLIYTLHKFFLAKVIRGFQRNIWPKVQDGYSHLLGWFLRGYNPFFTIAGLVFLFVFTLWFTAWRKPPVVFFPTGEPNFIYAYVKLPIGTDQKYTDSITQIVENRVFNVVGEHNPIVKSIISNVAVGASENSSGSFDAEPHLGKVTVAFVEFGKRNGKSSRAYLGKIREAVRGIPGSQITVDQEHGGPPVGAPISIEIVSENFDDLIKTANNFRNFIDSAHIKGIEELKSDFDADKPQLVFNIDRENARRQGLSTGQIGAQIRNAVFGDEVSRVKDEKEEHKVYARFSVEQRNKVQDLLNQKMIFRDMNMGGIIRSIPISSVAKIEYSNTFGGINRKNQHRIVNITSNVLTGYNANDINASIKALIPKFKKSDGISIKLGGEQEDQAEQISFLSGAFVTSIMLIFIILVTLFNSWGKPLIILSEIIFSLIGVLLGFSLFKMEISIIMTGIGVIALAGIVVRNGILLVEFSDLLISQGMNTVDAIREAGRTRMTPVILTALATTLGLIPLGIGFNIDFAKLFSELNPHIYFGGDNVAFWGPLSWTMIFGLIFGTFLTLIIVPVFYLIRVDIKEWIKGKSEINNKPLILGLEPEVGKLS